MAMRLGAQLARRRMLLLVTAIIRLMMDVQAHSRIMKVDNHHMFRPHTGLPVGPTIIQPSLGHTQLHHLGKDLEPCSVRRDSYFFGTAFFTSPAYCIAERCSVIFLLTLVPFIFFSVDFFLSFHQVYPFSYNLADLGWTFAFVIL